MDVAELSVSRREVLGAACAIALAGHSREVAEWGQLRVTVPSGDDDKWRRAVARFRAAEAALGAAQGAEDFLFDRVLGRFNRALAHLLRTPAPDIAALAGKLDLLLAHEVWELDFAQPCIAALRRDAGRLAGLNGDSYE
jgi:hypothetical protein